MLDWGIENALEYILFHYRWIFVCFFLLPCSFFYDIYVLFQNWISFCSKNATIKHQIKVHHVQKQVKQWMRSGQKTPMCTARPGWKSTMVQDPQYKMSDVSELTPPNTPNVNRNRKVNVRPDANADDKSETKSQRNARQSRGSVYKSIGGTELPKEVLHSITQFQRKRKKGHIDVWWLYDDGGLTLLLPYLIQTRSEWSNCKLRVFTLANKKDELQFEQRNMASLLAKFRIDYSDLKLIPDITKKPQEETAAFFETLIRDLKAPENDEDDKDQGYVTEAELMATKDKTNRHLRLRELLLENSTDAELVVMTLPMPRKNVVPAALYMAWLEVLSRDMPPFLLVRGNQQSVLTFYS